jgi:hypothetical protein
MQNADPAVGFDLFNHADVCEKIVIQSAILSAIDRSMPENHVSRRRQSTVQKAVASDEFVSKHYPAGSFEAGNTKDVDPKVGVHTADPADTIATITSVIGDAVATIDDLSKRRASFFEQNSTTSTERRRLDDGKRTIPPQRSFANGHPLLRRVQCSCTDASITTKTTLLFFSRPQNPATLSFGGDTKVQGAL